MPSLPWECVVLGVPASVQTKSSQRRRTWKASVTAAARRRWPSAEGPVGGHLHLRVTFFHDETPLDVDNMLKPIQDALIGVAYHDDNQIRDVAGSLRDLNNAYLVKGLTPALAEGFVSGEPFVHLRLVAAPDPKELP